MRTRRPRDYRTCRAHQVALPVCVGVWVCGCEWLPGGGTPEFHAGRNMEDMMLSKQVGLHDELESLAARHLRHTYIHTSEPT
jgi:hypothetical protein